MKKLVKGWRCSNLMKVEDEEAKLISIEKQENSISSVLTVGLLPKNHCILLHRGILGLCSEFKVVLNAACFFRFFIIPSQCLFIDSNDSHYYS